MCLCNEKVKVLTAQSSDEVGYFSQNLMLIVQTIQTALFPQVVVRGRIRTLPEGDTGPPRIGAEPTPEASETTALQLVAGRVTILSASTWAPSLLALLRPVFRGTFLRSLPVPRRCRTFMAVTNNRVRLVTSVTWGSVDKRRTTIPDRRSTASPETLPTVFPDRSTTTTSKGSIWDRWVLCINQVKP